MEDPADYGFENAYARAEAIAKQERAVADFELGQKIAREIEREKLQEREFARMASLAESPRDYYERNMYYNKGFAPPPTPGVKPPPGNRPLRFRGDVSNLRDRTLEPLGYWIPWGDGWSTTPHRGAFDRAVLEEMRQRCRERGCTVDLGAVGYPEAARTQYGHIVGGSVSLDMTHDAVDRLTWFDLGAKMTDWGYEAHPGIVLPLVNPKAAPALQNDPVRLAKLGTMGRVQSLCLARKCMAPIGIDLNEQKRSLVVRHGDFTAEIAYRELARERDFDAFIEEWDLAVHGAPPPPEPKILEVPPIEGRMIELDLP